jgi:hypothetical protein
MGANREEFSVEQAAVERDAARARAADEAAQTPEFKYDAVPRGYGVLMARETPAFYLSLDTPVGDLSPVLVERDLNAVQRVLDVFGDQRREIAWLRESTRQMLAGLSPA